MCALPFGPFALATKPFVIGPDSAGIVRLTLVVWTQFRGKAKK